MGMGISVEGGMAPPPGAEDAYYQGSKDKGVRPAVRAEPKEGAGPILGGASGANDRGGTLNVGRPSQYRRGDVGGASGGQGEDHGPTAVAMAVIARAGAAECEPRAARTRSGPDVSG